MKIQATKVFAKFISDTCKERGIKCEASLVTLPAHSYSFITGTDLWDAWCDYDKNGMYKAIRLEFPQEYYACSVHISTNELVREFRARNVSTWADLQDMVADIASI